MNRHSPVLRACLIALLIFAAWLAFFGLQALSSLAVGAESGNPARVLVEIDLVYALLWTGLTALIAAWHTRARSLWASAYALIAVHLPLLVVATVLDTYASREASAIFAGQTTFPPFLGTAIFFTDFEIVAYLAVVAVTETLIVRRALAERQRAAQRLETSIGRARLDYLEAQLQPHFLFNSLGAASELAYDAPAIASRVLRQLISIFRTALSRTSDEVTLGEEIVGIEPYLDIQRIRFADWLTIGYTIDDAAVDCLLPRFVLQPLIENAIRHGLSGRSAAGRIDISANMADESLIVRVTDNGIGLDATAASRTGRGIGLSNVRDRLAILYGDDDRLRLYASTHGGTTAELIVPARHRAAATPASSTSDTAPQPMAVLAIRIPAFLRRPVIAVPLLWLCWGIVLTQQSFLYQVIRHLLGDQTWWSIARRDMTSAAVWAALTPVVLLLGKRWPVERARIWLRAPAFVAIGAIVSLVQVVIVQQLTQPAPSLSSGAWQMSLLVNFILFCVIAVVAHHRVLRAWLDAREADARDLTERLAAAQERATKLRAIPPVLLQSLSGIEETVRHDPALTERQLARLADYLRLALECTDARGVTPERERALDAAVVTLRESGAYPLTVMRSG